MVVTVIPKIIKGSPFDLAVKMFVFRPAAAPAIEAKLLGAEETVVENNLKSFALR